MENKDLKEYLQQSLSEEISPQRLEETIKVCTEIVKEQRNFKVEPRTSFFDYLSDVFRFEGFPILGLQAITLLIVCLMLSSLANVPQYIPIFIPLFVLAVMPVFFKGVWYGMSEIEAVTRASGAEIMLAKLVLGGAANLVCMTILLFVEIILQNSYRELWQMILYCLVPYLVCMTVMLHLVRLQKKESILICAIIILGSCICWGILANLLPWLYKTSAIGLWIIAFLVFSLFFVKEVQFILKMRKEGKMYGIIT